MPSQAGQPYVTGYPPQAYPYTYMMQPILHTSCQCASAKQAAGVDALQQQRQDVKEDGEEARKALEFVQPSPAEVLVESKEAETADSGTESSRTSVEEENRHEALLLTSESSDPRYGRLVDRYNNLMASYEQVKKENEKLNEKVLEETRKNADASEKTKDFLIEQAYQGSKNVHLIQSLSEENNRLRADFQEAKDEIARLKAALGED